MERARWRQVWSGYLLAAVLAPAGVFWLTTLPADGPSTCVLRALAGIDCPGCGMTRAFRAMGRLDVVAAAKYNPLGPAAFVIVVACWAYVLAMLLSGGRLAMPTWWPRWRGRLLVAGLAVYLVVGFARMGMEIRHPELRPARNTHGVTLMPGGPALPFTTGR